MTEKLNGTVKCWFHQNKDFDFITSSSKDYFVHFSAIPSSNFKNLTPGQKVNLAWLKVKKVGSSTWK